MRKTPLRRKTPLKRGTSQLKRTPLKRQSEKAKAEAFIWVAVKRERARLLTEKFGFLICEFCGKAIRGIADGHHNDRNRRNNTLENCRILDRFPCHSHVTDQNIKDVPGLL